MRLAGTSASTTFKSSDAASERMTSDRIAFT
jgi:hypothetical protein